MRRQVLIGCAMAALVASACATSAGVAVVVATPLPAPPTVTPDPDVVAATPTPEPTAMPAATATPSVAGGPFDFLVPADGEAVAVVGVFFHDTLEVHELPGEGSPVVGELANLADNVTGTGEGWQLPNSIWWRIRADGVEGWVGSGFMARLGATNDVTANVLELVAGDGLEAETMLDLGTFVAGLLDSDDPASRVVVSVEPSGEDPGEVTMDIVGLGDDALAGLRVHVFGDPVEPGKGFTLRSVEATLLCSRGVTEDGLCV